MDVRGSAKNHGASLSLQACAGCAAAPMARGTKRGARGKRSGVHVENAGSVRRPAPGARERGKQRAPQAGARRGGGRAASSRAPPAQAGNVAAAIKAPICGLDKYMRTGMRPTKRCRNVGVYLECPSGSAGRTTAVIGARANPAWSIEAPLGRSGPSTLDALTTP